MREPVVNDITAANIVYDDSEHAWCVGGLYESHGEIYKAVKHQCPNMGQVTMGWPQSFNQVYLPVIAKGKK